MASTICGSKTFQAVATTIATYPLVGEMSIKKIKKNINLQRGRFLSVFLKKGGLTMGGQMAYHNRYETQKKEWRATWIENSDRVRFHRKGIDPAGGGQDP